jgi:hypothetical protein
MTADSRLNHMRATLDAAVEVAAEMYAENLDPHDAISLERAEKFILAAGQAIAAMSIYSPVVGVEAECGKYSCLGSLCVQPAGHTDAHLSAYGYQWTDESDRKSAEAIAKSMEGKRD